MTKQQFIENLEVELKREHVSDAADIIEEYDQHFAFKLADGYSEEEIAAKLGAPELVAAQYVSSQTPKSGGGKAFTMFGLCAADLFFGLLCILLFAWGVIMVVFSVACGAVSVSLSANSRLSVFALIPSLPSHCALIFGLAFSALTVLSVIGVIYFSAFIRQLTRSFSRFHRNVLASVSGRAALPSLPIYPQFPALARRRLRTITLLFFTVFAVCFIVGFVVCVFSAGALEFWHAWGWFGYVR